MFYMEFKQTKETRVFIRFWFKADVIINDFKRKNMKKIKIIRQQHVAK